MPTVDASVIAAIVGGYYSAPFDVLGLHQHPDGRGLVIRTFQPEAKEVEVQEGDRRYPMERVHAEGFFEVSLPERDAFFIYQLAVTDWNGRTTVIEDPYRFSPVLNETDLYLFNEGNLLRAYEKLGAHPMTHEGAAGVTFAVWAPSALRVSVIGVFNNWDGRRHPMRPRGASGLWELFIPGLGPGAVYKYEVKSRYLGYMANKADPYGFASEVRPANASIVYDLGRYQWNDGEWLSARAQRQNLETPMSIYEVHLGSWKRKGANEWLTYRELADDLVPYVRDLGYTHLETMPIAEHPYDGSWGYQVTGYYAPTARFGSPDDFRYFVDKAHQAGLGVIVDWVPAHFPKDEHGLGYFDGTHLYEHADPRQGEHKDWGTFIFNFGRNEVRNFLLSNALFWLEQYHIDGLRVDAVASMLYLDYSRKHGEWIPNRFGGRENLEAVDFLKRFNELVHQEFPGTLTYAEESTAWPMVSRPVYVGGLGFGMKWNMGWMHDTLEYLALDPALRRHHHELLTFGLLYAFTENFMLPLSHDEVVHGKGSLLARMPGDRRQRFASLRLLYVYMWTYPGKKFLFMGNELAQEREWDHAGALDWELLGQPEHRGVQTLIRDLNLAYRTMAGLHAREFTQDGFEWLDCHDAAQSVMVYLRRGGEPQIAVVVFNFAALARCDYRVGVPLPGMYREVINSDALRYGGDGGMNGDVYATPVFHMGQSYSLVIDLPPLTGIVLTPAEATLGDEWRD